MAEKKKKTEPVRVLPKTWNDAREAVVRSTKELANEISGVTFAGVETGEQEAIRRITATLAEIETVTDWFVLSHNQLLQLGNSLAALREAYINHTREPSSGPKSEHYWKMLAATEDAWGLANAILVLRGKHRPLEDEASTLVAEATKVVGEINAMKQQLSIAFPDAMVQAQQKHFDDERKAHDVEAKKWLQASGGVLGGLILVALVAGVLQMPDCVGAIVKDSTDVYQHMGVVAAKVAIVSGLYYLLVVCVKNYRAHRHLAVSYEQRKNAIGTFQAFVDAADGDDEEAVKVRNAILLATTSAIFSPVATGYSTDQPDPTPMQALETVKAIKS